MFSKSEVIERRIQPDIWLSRSTSAFAMAIAPTLISPVDHSQIDRAAVAKISTLLMTLSDTIIIMIVAGEVTKRRDVADEALLREGFLALGMGEELHRLDVGVAVDDASREPGIGLGHRLGLRPDRRHHVVDGDDIGDDPQRHRQDQPGVEADEERRSCRRDR